MSSNLTISGGGGTVTGNFARLTTIESMKEVLSMNKRSRVQLESENAQLTKMISKKEKEEEEKQRTQNDPPHNQPTKTPKKTLVQQNRWMCMKTTMRVQKKDGTVNIYRPAKVYATNSHKCKICGEVFNRSCELSNHELIHINEPLYTPNKKKNEC